MTQQIKLESVSNGTDQDYDRNTTAPTLTEREELERHEKCLYFVKSNRKRNRFHIPGTSPPKKFMKEAKFEEYGCSTRFVVYGKNCDRKETERE